MNIEVSLLYVVFILANFLTCIKSSGWCVKLAIELLTEIFSWWCLSWLDCWFYIASRLSIWDLSIKSRLHPFSFIILLKSSFLFKDFFLLSYIASSGSFRSSKAYSSDSLSDPMRASWIAGLLFRSSSCSCSWIARS